MLVIVQSNNKHSAEAAINSAIAMAAFEQDVKLLFLLGALDASLSETGPLNASPSDANRSPEITNKIASLLEILPDSVFLEINEKSPLILRLPGVILISNSESNNLIHSANNITSY